MAKYKRILLKLSGESLMGDQQYGIDQNRLGDYAEQIAEIDEKLNFKGRIEREEWVAQAKKLIS